MVIGDPAGPLELDIVNEGSSVNIPSPGSAVPFVLYVSITCFPPLSAGAVTSTEKDPEAFVLTLVSSHCTGVGQVLHRRALCQAALCPDSPESRLCHSAVILGSRRILLYPSKTRASRGASLRSVVGKPLIAVKLSTFAFSLPTFHSSAIVQRVILTMQTIVIGHRNPDMDSICAAIAYAELKRLTGTPNVIAARAGSTNERIDFVLEKFGVPSPEFISDLSPRVCDVMERGVISIMADSSVYDAMQLIEQKQMRGLPVVDSNCRCLGLLSAFKVLHHLFPPREEVANTRVVAASPEIVRTFGGSMIAGTLDTETRDYLLVVGWDGRRVL